MTNEHIGAPETMRRYRPEPADAALRSRQRQSGSALDEAVPFQASGMIVAETIEPTDAWTLYRACRVSDTRNIYQSDTALAGSEAYERLARITAVIAYGLIDGEYLELSAVDPEPDGQAVRPELIRVVCTVERGGRTLRMSVVSDVAVTGEPESLGENCRPFVTPTTGIGVDELSELMELAAFSAWDDTESDSWETQYSEFRDEARAQATALLVSEDAAALMRIRERVRSLPLDH